MSTYRRFAWATVALLILGAWSRADDQAAARAIIEKAIKATGDLEKYAHYQGGLAKGKGTLHAMGQMLPFTVDYRFQWPDKSRTEIGIEVMGQEVKVLNILNGDKGWAKVGDMVNDMTEDQLAEAKAQLHALLVTALLPLRDKSYTLSLVGDMKVNGVEAVGVRVEHQGAPDVGLFFDKKTHLLVMSRHRMKDPMAGGAEVEEETVYSDYKEKDGVKYAMKLTIQRDGKLLIEAEMEEYASLEKQEDALFAKP